MDQVYIDTLNTVVIHKYDLDALVLELEAADRHNTILYIALLLVVLTAAIIVFKVIKNHKRQLAHEQLTKKLLSKQAHNLPYISDSINKISNKTIKVSASLYDELQAVLNNVKNDSKNSFIEIVNDSDFVSRHPYIKEMSFLTPSEKLVLILTEEGYPVKEIALYIGSSDTSIRAMKTRIRNKLTQSDCEKSSYKRLKILKKK